MLGEVGDKTSYFEMLRVTVTASFMLGQMLPRKIMKVPERQT